MRLSEWPQCGSILIFEDCWVLNHEIAAAIRTIRRMKGLAYEDLADVTVRRTISSLEQAQVNISIGKLDDLASALNFDFVALVALCVALREDADPEQIIQRASATLDAFSTREGMAQLRSQLNGGKIVPRKPGKPTNGVNLASVMKLRARGLNQAEISRELGLSKSTVNRYWKLSVNQPQ
ncbi:Winged helix-turn-helix DNA-binding [Pseudomonas deceptionensis]|uniref:Winged helix-turn-helix DNA-binding n=1 Tax=Pseudomonas deceptionensis TaxID=882211 RepID=A0A1H5N7Q5_PSEDM|nr:Winged helix-turn-helix DNA-binding [Pseudomonas deceptionensis]